MPQSEKSNLHGDLPFGSYPPRPSVNKMTSKFYTEEHDICDGEVKLLRTKQSGKVWQIRCYIKPHIPTTYSSLFARYSCARWELHHNHRMSDL